MKAKSSVWVVGMLELAFLLPPRFTEAQQTQTYSDAWLLLLNHVELNDRWVLGNELHWRSTHFLGDKEQLLIRPFVTYRTTNVDYSAGNPRRFGRALGKRHPYHRSRRGRHNHRCGLRRSASRAIYR